MIRLAAALLFGLAVLPAFYGTTADITVYTPYASATTLGRSVEWTLLAAALLIALLTGPWVAHAASLWANAGRGLAAALLVTALALTVLTLRSWAVSRGSDYGSGSGHFIGGDNMWWSSAVIGAVVALRLLITFPLAGLLLGLLARRSA